MKHRILLVFSICALVVGFLFILPSKNALAFAPGCYDPSTSSARIACPTGAINSSGNPISPATNCYVLESSLPTVTIGTSSLIWEQVPCTNLKSSTGPYAPGCYNTANGVSTAIVPSACPTGAVDAAGNALAPTKNCYVPETAPITGQTRPWDQVSCTDLATPAGSTPNPLGGSGSGSGSVGSTSQTCEASGWSLSWIACPVIDAIKSAETGLFDVVQSLLKTTPVIFNGNDCSNKSASDSAEACVYQVWTSFRDIGDVVLVIALLVVVFAEAAGGGLIDAYTAKKMLPRILVAAILINLSIYIVAALEDITNIIGSGLYSFISAPFPNHGTWGITLNGFGGDALGFGALAGAGALWAIGGAAFSFLLLFLGLPVLLAALGVLITLMLRQGILIFLVMVSPIAFALYCLPNTEQFFRRWWDLLFKTLMVYPIVVAVFVMADVSGQIISTLPITPQWLAQIMGVLAILAPLFLIPFAFKISGGALGAIYEGAHGLGQRAQGAIKGDARDEGSLQNRVRSRLNQRRSQTGLSNAAIGERLGGFLPGRRNVYTRAGRRQLGEALATRRGSDLGVAGQQYLEADKIWQQYKEDSKFTMAVGNRALAQSRRDDAARKGNYDEVTQWQQALNNASLIHSSAGTRMAATQAWLASGYDLNDNGQEAYNEMAKTFADITGSAVRTDATGNVTGFTGANAAAAIGAMNTAQASMARNGQFHLAGINYGTGYDADAGLAKADPFSWGRGKPGSAIGAKDSALQHIRRGTNDDLKKAAVYKQELQSIAQSSTGAQRDEALKAVAALSDTTARTAGMTNPAEIAKEVARAGAATSLRTWETGNTGNILKGERLDRAALASQATASIAADPVANAGRTWEDEALDQGWTAAEIAQGNRDRAETNKDVADREARTTRIPREDE